MWTKINNFRRRVIVRFFVLYGWYIAFIIWIIWGIIILYCIKNC